MPASRSEVHVCPVCERPFARPAYRDLHLGRRHPEALDADQQRAFQAAIEEESAWMTRFRRHVRAALAALVVMLVYGKLVVLATILEANPGMLILPAPGILAFAMLVYALVYTHQRDVTAT